MDPNYTVTIIVCVLSMIILAIDVGKNTILSKSDIKWFRITFILAALGACLEYCGVIADKIHFLPPRVHWFVTFLEFSISPYLAISLARSSGMKHKIKPMFILLGVNVLIEIISLFTGIVFYVDSDGMFHRGPAYWTYLFFCGISFIYILFVFILIGIRSRLRYLINIILIASVMIMGQVANTIDGSINSGYMSLCVTATLLYICMQNMLRHVMIETINIEKNISNHDVLTKVHSRFSYDTKIREINKQINEAKADLQFAICECDLNNLKTINDSFGHDNGDKYIVSCCKNICHFFKHSPVYRIGGDEFVAVIQNEDFENLEQIKETIHKFAVSEITKDVSLVEKKSYAVGFAVFDAGHDKNFADVMKRADAEMYENKKMLKSL